MRIKSLLLALMALPIFMVACDPDTPQDEVKNPTVKVSVGAATENSITFTVTSADAEKVAYLVVEGVEAPTASEVFATGTGVEVNKSVEVKAEDLKAETDYTIIVAAKNAKGAVKSEVSKKTLASGEQPADNYLELKSNAEMSFTADGGNGEIAYEVVNEAEGAQVTATADAEWITDVVVASGKVTFVVAANEGAAREAKIAVAYHTDSFEVKVKQAAKGTTPQPGDVVEFVATEISTDYFNEDGLHLYAFELADKGWKDNGWGMDGGTYYTFVIVASKIGGGVLPNGSYVLADDYSANTIDVNSSYLYKMENGTMAGGMQIYEDATVVITDGKIEANVELANGEIHHVVYEGNLSCEDGGSQTPIEFEATHTATKWYWGGSSNYGNKYQVVGDNFSVDVHFQPAKSTETTLVAGTYTWTTTTMWGYNDFEEFTTRTFTVDGVSVAVDSGKVDISNEGDVYHIEMTLMGRNGFAYMIQYDGKLNDREDVGGDNSGYVVTSLSKGTYNSTYYFYTFKAECENGVTFDLLLSSEIATETTIKSGAFSYAIMKSFLGTGDYFFIEMFKIDGVTYKPQISSQMEVTGDGTNIAFTLNLYMDSGDNIVVTYEGAIE